MPQFNRILITGAAGRLGTVLREGLAPLATTLRLSDRTGMGEAASNEELAQCELSDFDAVMSMVEGVDAIVHFGGQPVEGKFDAVLESTIIGSYNVYEAARRHGVKRVIYASSIHAVGYHLVEDNIDSRCDHRPDSLYGVSKCYVEDLARLYFDKFEIESVCLRICSSFDEPVDRRMLWSMITYRDLVQLVERSLLTSRVGFTVAYGTSDNLERPVSNRYAAHLGYRPVDNMESYRDSMVAKTETPDAFSPTHKFVGGWFCDLPHPDEIEDN